MTQIKTKQDLYNAIITRVFADGGYVYGGYVRDLLAGIEPHDIDVQVRHPFEFIIGLKEIADNVTIVSKENGKGQYDATHPIVKIEIAAGEIKVLADVSVTGTFHKADVDVNQLQLQSAGIFSKNRKNIIEVINHIRNRQFVCLPECASYRREKMLAKGWVEIVENPDIAKKHSIVIYDDAGIKKELDIHQGIYDVVAAVYQSCDKIMAIKVLRACTGCGLRDGKDAIEKWLIEDKWCHNPGLSSLQSFYERNLWVFDSLVEAYKGKVVTAEETVSAILCNAGMVRN